MPNPPRPPRSKVYDATVARDVTVVADNGATATFDQIRRFATLHDPDCLAQSAGIHVVEQKASGPGDQCGFDLVDPVDLERARNQLRVRLLRLPEQPHRLLEATVLDDWAPGAPRTRALRPLICHWSFELCKRVCTQLKSVRPAGSKAATAKRTWPSARPCSSASAADRVCD